MTSDDLKRIVAERAVDDYVKDGMKVGLGTGSTAYHAIRRVGRLVRENGYNLTCVATSSGTEGLAREYGIDTVSINEVGHLDVTIDGADEVDPEMQLIKGLGGALLREKIVAAASRQEIIVVDESKKVDVLGTRAPLPVEVLAFGHPFVKTALERQGCVATLRMSGGLSLRNRRGQLHLRLQVRIDKQPLLPGIQDKRDSGCCGQRALPEPRVHCPGVLIRRYDREEGSLRALLRHALQIGHVGEYRGGPCPLPGLDLLDYAGERFRQEIRVLRPALAGALDLLYPYPASVIQVVDGCGDAGLSQPEDALHLVRGRGLMDGKVYEHLRGVLLHARADEGIDCGFCGEIFLCHG
jgi:ribose 5-phosphate isomerase A